MFNSVNRRDLIAGLALLTAALIWISLVVMTVEPAQGPEAGARAFPLFFGVALAVLAVILAVQGLRGGDDDTGDGGKAEVSPPLATEVWFVGGTIVLTILYGTVMEKLGFLVATLIFVAAVVVLLLRIRRPLFVGAMAVGLSLGAYIVFGKLLGTYLPPGTWITIYF